MSTTSSLRPTSATSCISRELSGGSGAASVRWDEAGLQTAKEVRGNEKEARSKEKAREKAESKEKRKSKKTSKDSTRKSSDNRKRTPLSAIFTGIALEGGTVHQPATLTAGVYEPEQHGVEVGNSLVETPVKRVRPRPVSRQSFDRSQRSQAFYEGDDDRAVMSLLDAATNSRECGSDNCSSRRTTPRVQSPSLSRKSLCLASVQESPRQQKKSSLVPRAALDSGNLPILPEVHCTLGLAGTMGGSVGSIPEQIYDGSDPDSDIPDELRVILSDSGQEGEDTTSLDRRSARPGEHSFSFPRDYGSRELLPNGFPIDVDAEPSLLPGSDCFTTTGSDAELLDAVAPQILRNATAVASQPSNGQLKRDFKFGGKHSSPSKNEASPPLTLSDIIPPPEVASSLSTLSFAGDESSLMKSIRRRE